MYLTDVKGIKVGHANNQATGLTVIIPPKGTVCAVDVRGGGPGTRETDLLDPKNMVQGVDAIMLTGGSAYGLNAAAGVMKYLEEENRGVDVGLGIVPVVSGAVIFDLAYKDYKTRPDAEMGYEAAKNASEKENRLGNVGVGLGATVGKILGMESAMKGGLGSYTIKVGQVTISALSVVNSFGDIFEDGKKIAGAINKKTKEFYNPKEILKLMEENKEKYFKGTNTTLSVLATNVKLNKTQAEKVANVAHNGYAMSIFPVHTQYDGDTVFVLSTGQVEADPTLVQALGSICVKNAIISGVKNAKTEEGYLAMEDLWEF